MKRIYPLFSSLAVLPLAAYCTTRKDLRPGLLRRFWPKTIDLEKSDATRIWIHAASAGEVALANHFASTYLEKHQSTIFLLTTNTASGMRQASAGPYNFVRSYPFDSYPAINRLFDGFAPQAVVSIEMEIWPGLIEKCRRHQVPVVIINGRMSDESKVKYASLNEKLGGFMSIPYFLSRSDTDMLNLIDAGADIDRSIITGEMKIDLTKLRSESDKSLSVLSPAMLAASTHRGEENIALDAFDKLRDTYPDLKLILAPRHLQRSTHILAQAAKHGYATVLADDHKLEDIAWADVIIENRFGRMERWYRQSKVTLVGGSFGELGGHSVIEPLLFDQPAIIGPSHDNWLMWVKLLDEVNALSVVEDANDIARIVAIVMDEPRDVARAVAKGRSLVELHCGSTTRNVEVVQRLIEGGDPLAFDQ